MNEGMFRVEEDPRRDDRIEVVRRVGAAIARSPASPTAPILAEGSVACALPQVATTGPRRRRAVRSWAVAAVVLAVATAGLLGLAARHATRSDDARFPLVATADERASLEREGARWRRGKARLLTALAAFDAPSLDRLTGVGACPLGLAAPPIDGRAELEARGHDPAVDGDADVSTRLVVLPGEALDGLDALARPELDAMLAAAARGRFRTEAGRAHVLHALASAFLVVTLDEYRGPASRPQAALTPGVAAGTAYLFEPSTGTLRCAGRFRAESTSMDDLEVQTDRAIARSLRSID